jgi:hypothetical protein
MNQEARESLLKIYKDRTEGNMKLRSAEVIKQEPDLLEYTWKIIQTSSYPVNFRAAWCFDYFTELFPQYAAQHVEQAIEFSLESKESGIVRQLLRFHARQDLTEDQLFRLLEFCEGNCLDPQVPAAIRVHSLELLKISVDISRIFSGKLKLFWSRITSSNRVRLLPGEGPSEKN